MGSWYTGGGGDVPKSKNHRGGGLQNTLEPMEKYVNRPLSDKNMKFCIVVAHDLTNDISYNAKLNRS